jgi:hypothetical protein
MQENCKAWWEGIGAVKFIREFVKHPATVARQVGVACDMEQAPTSSNQETFPALSPEEASKLLMQEKAQNQRRAYLESLIEEAKSGNPEALEDLSSIANFGKNPSARRAIKEIDNSNWKARQ